VTIVLAVTWVAAEGEADAVEHILRQLQPLSRAEPGCLQYDVHVESAVPGTFFIFERYADQAALEAHAASSHFKELVLGQAVPRLASRERRLLAPLQ
jgi:quinol monooxygenase YgiN